MMVESFRFHFGLRHPAAGEIPGIVPRHASRIVSVPLAATVACPQPATRRWGGWTETPAACWRGFCRSRSCPPRPCGRKRGSAPRDRSRLPRRAACRSGPPRVPGSASWAAGRTDGPRAQTNTRGSRSDRSAGSQSPGGSPRRYSRSVPPGAGRDCVPFRVPAFRVLFWIGQFGGLVGQFGSNGSCECNNASDLFVLCSLLVCWRSIVQDRLCLYRNRFLL
mmetsp:Transcript_23804/g.56062  ORF Transcript_23804/g.56062 Transcript_23804/m.56062 type:complete len:221 (+) Transcript_23804:343-1005(+)